jgi:hypothetical protein
MDASYAITRVFAALEAREIEAVIPAKAERPPKRGTTPMAALQAGRQAPHPPLPGWSAPHFDRTPGAT